MVAEREPPWKHDQAKIVESALRGQQTLQVHGLHLGARQLQCNDRLAVAVRTRRTHHQRARLRLHAG
ncbi:MAG: hypothetical protein K0S14_3696 [Thermomicrobiales bacterium]|nr:hypothetical protein [Thermomicrobiales bacterium]